MSKFILYKYPIRFFKLLLGFILLGLGLAMNYQSYLGLSPWTTFHEGISLVSGLSLGTVIQLVGLFFIIVSILMKQPIGFGTIANMIVVGEILDLIIKLGIIVKPETILTRWLLLIISIFITAYGTYLYMSSSLGAGPRDTIMVLLAKMFPKVSLGIIRNCIELTVLIIGFYLGGLVGAGTVVYALCLGPCLNFFFKLNKFEVTNRKSESIIQTFELLYKKS